VFNLELPEAAGDEGEAEESEELTNGEDAEPVTE